VLVQEELIEQVGPEVEALMNSHPIGRLPHRPGFIVAHMHAFPRRHGRIARDADGDRQR
jgi:hypothetical protein